MFWTGIVIGLFAGACLGFALSLFFFTKIESSTKRKWSHANPAEPLERDIAVSDQFLLKYLASEVIRFDETPN